MKITGKSPQPWENTGGGKNPKLKNNTLLCAPSLLLGAWRSSTYEPSEGSSAPSVITVIPQLSTSSTTAHLCENIDISQN